MCSSRTRGKEAHLPADTFLRISNRLAPPVSRVPGDKEEIEKAQRQQASAAAAAAEAAAGAASECGDANAGSPVPMETDAASSAAEAGAAGPSSAATPAAAAAAQDVEMAAVASEGTSRVPYDLSPALAEMESLEAQGYLAESINHSTRMLESLLTNAETSREFVQRGGVDLLLKVGL